MQRNKKVEDYQQDFTIEIRGIIIPSEWDRHGNVDKVLIETNEEEQFFIQMDENGQKILRLLKRPVKIQGHYWINEWGELWIKVDKFCQLKSLQIEFSAEKRRRREQKKRKIKINFEQRAKEFNR